jgi:AraC family transcriptional activator of pobA
MINTGIFSSMRAAPQRAIYRNNAAPVDAIPAFFLYGEPLQPPDERLIHIETISARSKLNDWNIRPHRHRDLHQVLLTFKGSVEVRLDATAACLASPALVVVPPGCVHSFVFEQGTGGIVLSFSPGLAAELSTASIGLAEYLRQPQARPLVRATMQETDLKALGEMLLREFTRAAPGRHAALRGLLEALLANVWRLGSGEETPAGDTLGTERELVARYRRVIEVHFRLHCSVRAYAAELGVSESRLRRACLAVTGQPPVAAVHLRMLVEAERLLRYTTMSISQVAYHLGFEDPAYFSRFFARFKRSSPRAFRACDGAAGTIIR